MRRIIKSGPSPRSRRARGVTLVELLVAMVISLIAITAIFQVFSVFEGQKRTTMGGGEAQTNGALALFTLERELRQAGYGVSSTSFLGCNIQVWDELTGGAFALTFAPVQIIQGAGEAPDTITVLYGSGNLVPNPVNLIENMLDPNAPFRVSNRYGFQAGDIMLVAEAGLDCTLAQASSLPTVVGDQDLVLHASGTFTDPENGAITPTRYNKPGGSGVTYTFNSRVFNLGPRPSNNIYSVQNGQLALQPMLSVPSTAVTAIYDGIVQVKAQYGKDTIGNDGIIDVFDATAPTNAAEWAQVLAVRVAVVARSALYEKEEVSPATLKLWEDSAVAPTTIGPVWTLTADERHYRYKVFQTIVPIRNMIWRP
jgi:type IV pilus assembly protein PilW